MVPSIRLGKHQLTFLARGPNLSNLSFLGLYDQYFASYSNKNIELFVGDKAFHLTPLTESSRFGFGTESKVIFNNGFTMGFTYVKPRYFEDFKNEIAGYTGFIFKNENEIKLYYVQKNDNFVGTPVQLASVTTKLSPLKKTNIDIEISKGYYNKVSDNAFRAGLNTQFWMLHFAGIYFYTGKDYPGYFSNSKFYSGNLSVNLSKKLSLSVFAKEDFRNAELDTLFVTAPYTKSFQSSINYNIAQRAYLKFFWREYERKDRLILDKFHYKTKSINTQFNHKFKKINYDLSGEFGKTTNLLLSENNQQITYRGIVNVGYRFNTRNSIRLSGSWSNINSFVSGDRRNVTAGLFIISQITRNLKADLHVQNAYDIDDYYRNRNLMQLNFQYSIRKHHVISARSFYTLFTKQVENPEFTTAISYTYKFGVPLKQIIKAGNVKGRIVYDNEEPAEGVILNLLNKTAITNRNGEYVISTIQPGRHALFVDRSNFKIDELTDIPSPIEVDVFEDQESVVNFRITTGAKLTGKISIKENDNELLKNPDANPGNIIVELKNDFYEFRIATDKDGNFSFPIVRPGNYVFKIYQSSVPNGFELEKTQYQIYFSPGDKQNLQIELKSKRKNIIFKSQNTTLTPVKKEIQTTDNVIENDRMDIEENADTLFYSIQIAAFSKKQNNDSGFFANQHFDFECQTGTMYKYFVGKYKTLSDAKKERERLSTEFRNPFIVVFKNGILQQ